MFHGCWAEERQMNRSGNQKRQSLNVRRYALLLAGAWTLAVGVSFSASYQQEKISMIEAAKVEARAQFDKDMSYRRWNAGHGGVYVPITETTKPNPYLAHMKVRDLETTTGLRLTLINPAYMTRQVHEQSFSQGGIRGHITSLGPMRPANGPDHWERRALESFERGERESRRWSPSAAPPTCA